MSFDEIEIEIEIEIGTEQLAQNMIPEFVAPKAPLIHESLMA